MKIKIIRNHHLDSHFPNSMIYGRKSISHFSRGPAVVELLICLNSSRLAAAISNMFPTFVPHWVTHTSHNCQKISTINHGNQRSSMTSPKNLFRSSISYIPSPKNIPQTHTPHKKKTHPAFFGESSQNNTYIRFKSEKKNRRKPECRNLWTAIQESGQRQRCSAKDLRIVKA